MMQSESKNAPLRCKFEIATNRMQEDDFLADWNKFLLTSESHDKIYQTPDFFKFLLETSNGEDQLEIFSVTREEDGKLIGIVPVRIRKHEEVFKIGINELISPKMLVIGLLGSVPLVPDTFDLAEDLFVYLFKQFPECQAICLAALPSASMFWQSIQNSIFIMNNFCICVVDDWRRCHIIPLLTSFECYLQKFSTKKRYNLNRQIRLLREHHGNLSLLRIQNKSEVEQLMSAINQLTSTDGHSVFLSQKKCEVLANNNLLLCYVLVCGQTPSALIFGTHSNDVFHVHNILRSKSMHQFSIGTSILHLAIEDLTASFTFSSIDLGYGVPGHVYQSSNITKERGHVLIFRKTMKNKLWCLLHKFHNHAMFFAKIIMGKFEKK